MKNQILIKKTMSLLTLAMAAALTVTSASPARADGKERERKHHGLYGSEKLLTVFADLYFRNAFGNITLPTDSNGNTVVGGTVLMPLPNAPGDGTPASID